MRFLVPLLCLVLVAGCAPKGHEVRAVDVQELVGTWKVDLRSKPGDPEYHRFD